MSLLTQVLQPLLGPLHSELYKNKPYYHNHKENGKHEQYDSQRFYWHFSLLPDVDVPVHCVDTDVRRVELLGGEGFCEVNRFQIGHRALSSSPDDQVVNAKFRNADRLTEDHRLLYAVLQHDDVILVGSDHQVLVENYLVQHVILEVVRRPVQVHHLEHRVPCENEYVFLLLDENLSDVYQRVSERLLLYPRPSHQRNTMYLVARKVQSLRNLRKLHQVTHLF